MRYRSLLLLLLMVAGLLSASLFVSIVDTTDQGSAYAQNRGPGNNSGNSGNGWGPGNNNGNAGNPPGQRRNDLVPVPEPASLLLMGAGLVGFAVVRKRMKKRDHKN